MIEVVFISVSFAIWFGMHKLMPTIAFALISALKPPQTVAWFEGVFGGLSKVKKDYFCRLTRGQVYYVWATCCGAYLMAQVRSVHDLLYLYTDDHQVIYCIAAANWTLAFWEDWKGRQYLSVRVDEDDRFQSKKLRFDPNSAMLIGYAVHHTLTLFAYGFIIYTGKISLLGAFGAFIYPPPPPPSVKPLYSSFLRTSSHIISTSYLFASHAIHPNIPCVTGLLFEGPVIFANMREFVIIFDEDFDLLTHIQEAMVRINWCITFCMLLLCRFPSGLLYLWALVFWREQVGTLPMANWMVYHTLGVLFGCINMYWLGLLCLWCNQDMHRMDVRTGRVAAIETGRAAAIDSRATGGARQHATVGGASAGAVSATAGPASSFKEETVHI
jgi:hypothetical protein